MPDPRLQFADDELTEMLRSVDHAPPPLNVDHLMMRVRRRHAHRSMMIAAATFVVAAAAAAAAVPGSTLRDFFRQAPVARASQTTPLPHHTTGAAGARGIAFVPEQRVVITFAATQRSGSARVRVANESSVRITQTSDAQSAHFGLTPDGVSVNNTGSAASYDVVIPAAAHEVVLRIAERTAFTKSGAESTCLGVDNPGHDCLIPLQP